MFKVNETGIWSSLRAILAISSGDTINPFTLCNAVVSCCSKIWSLPTSLSPSLSMLWGLALLFNRKFHNWTSDFALDLLTCCPHLNGLTSTNFSNAWKIHIGQCNTYEKTCKQNFHKTWKNSFWVHFAPFQLEG